MFEKDLVVEECMKLDTRLVRDWHVRENQWCRRARLVAREFRDGDASSYETFSPTTPVAVVKMLIVMSLLHGLATASIDVGDAFLQVPQTSLVLIEVPLWALRAGDCGEGKQFWVLKRWPTRPKSGGFRMEQVLHGDLREPPFRELPGHHLQAQEADGLHLGPHRRFAGGWIQEVHQQFLQGIVQRAELENRGTTSAWRSRRGEKPRQRFEGFLKTCRFRHSETTDSCPKIGSKFPGILKCFFKR